MEEEKAMRGVPTNPTESFMNLNPHLYPPHIRVVEQGPERRIRQSSKPKLNQLESEFYLRLKDTGWKIILCQDLKLRLGNGVWYTPDFVTFGIGVDSHTLVVWEVKGEHVWEDSIVKLKVAAALYPFSQFRLANKDCGNWQYQIVLP